MGFNSVFKGLTFKNSTWFSLCVECFVRISEQAAVLEVYVINGLVFITAVESVYSAVRTDSLYKQITFRLKRLIIDIKRKFKEIFAPPPKLLNFAKKNKIPSAVLHILPTAVTKKTFQDSAVGTKNAVLLSHDSY